VDRRRTVDCQHACAAPRPRLTTTNHDYGWRSASPCGRPTPQADLRRPPTVTKNLPAARRASSRLAPRTAALVWSRQRQKTGQDWPGLARTAPDRLDKLLTRPYSLFTRARASDVDVRAAWAKTFRPNAHGRRATAVTPRLPTAACLSACAKGAISHCPARSNVQKRPSLPCLPCLP
jgi:hypothetical protein